MGQHRSFPTNIPACLLVLVHFGIVTSRSIASVLPYTNVTMPLESKVSSDFRNATFTKLSSLQECTLTSVHPVRDTMEGFLLEGAKLIELDLVLENYPPDFLNNRLTHVFQPHHWVRSTGREGRKLLTLEDNYDFMSVATLSMNVKKMKVNLTDSPRNCLKTLDEEQTLLTFRTVLLNDFKPQGQEDGSLSEDEHICHMKIIEEGKFADFIYSCCHKSPEGDIVCVDIDKDVWTHMLLVFVIFTKIMAVLFSPFFIPRRLYRDDLGSVEYIYQPNPPTKKKAGIDEQLDEIMCLLKQKNSKTGETDTNARVESKPEDPNHGQRAAERQTENSADTVTSNYVKKPTAFTMKVVKKTPDKTEKAEKVVPLRQLKDMNTFKELVRSECRPGHLYYLTFKKVRLSVKSRQLLDKNTVPAGVFTVLYNNLVRCRLRKIGVMTDCCNATTGICGLTWYQCGRAVSRLVLLCLCLLPWALRLWVYFTYEEDVVSQKKTMAERYGLKYWSGSFTLLLTPLHVLFIVTYVVLVADFLMYGTINRAMKETFRFALAKSLNDMSELRNARLCEGFTKWLILPCEKMGAFGIVLYPFYAVFLLVAGLPVAAFYLSPALQLTARLVKHSIRFLAQWLEGLCPKKDIWNRCHWMEPKTKAEKELRPCVQIVVIFMCFVLFWSLTFLFMETLTFFVEVVVYTLTGIIVNAQHTLDYITVAFFVVVYARMTFNGVYKKYLNYHRQIHEELLKMKRNEINEVAKQDEKDQRNMAFHVPGYTDLAKESSEQEIIKLIVNKGRPRFKTRGILLFLDNKDTVYTPEWFFYEAITLKHREAPGPLYLSYSKAFRNFGFILLFLFFVFTVVMAFGDTYKISPTNKLLATVAGSFIPFLFRNVFSSGKGDSDIDIESIQFREKLQKAIEEYQQEWTVFDFGTLDTPDSTVEPTRLWFFPECLERNNMQNDQDNSKSVGNKKEGTTEPFLSRDEQDKLNNQGNSDSMGNKEDSQTEKTKPEITVKPLEDEEVKAFEKGEKLVDMIVVRGVQDSGACSGCCPGKDGARHR
ncbi:uncharacterized protein [Littorina saxatilis]|uniref:uncharacterized protein isoform X2 n=1 Tax=Littorina saxatilis TaxID=31220 RepID=UPI0038B64B19